jgi:hypothetical protein
VVNHEPEIARITFYPNIKEGCEEVVDISNKYEYHPLVLKLIV